MSQTAGLYEPFPARYCGLLTRDPGSILLQTSRCDENNYRSYLFMRPLETLSATESGQLAVLFNRIDQALRERRFVAGFLSFECGEHFQQSASNTVIENGVPLAWFGVYDTPFVFNHVTGAFEGSAPEEPEDGTVGESFEIRLERLSTGFRDYAALIDRIKSYIRAGDTYQVNLTDKLLFEFAGSPVAMFAELSRLQPVSYGAFLNLGSRQILSFSPELFFRIREGKIFTRPMKGTARRGRYLGEDNAIAEWLTNDIKNRSENVMIVDLLRNDVGRICTFGTVKVDELFAVEKYETLFQMTSAVSGTLKPGTSYYEIFQSLFPCGSVTGAPKIRTMEIIRELEREQRGVYTGAIGFFSPNSEAVFNVAIRTVVLTGSQVEMGIGSGITIDSSAESEYHECALKAEFLTRREPPFELIETMLWDGGYRLQHSHFERLRSSAEYFGFKYDHRRVTALLAANERELQPGLRYKVRVLLAKSGAITIQNSGVHEQQGTARITLSPTRTSSEDRFLYHKTTQRSRYDEAYTQARLDGYDDVLFCNERGEVTEGAISNILVEQSGKLYTPPITCGLLPGVYRQYLLSHQPAVEEKILYLHDLQSADAIYLCNAVRGLRRVGLELSATRTRLTD